MNALDTCLGVAQASDVRYPRVAGANETVAPARSGAALRAAHWLSLAAAPTFAAMALLATIPGGGPADMLCAATREASPLSGMVPMYALMSAFHAGPWLKLISMRLPLPACDRLRGKGLGRALGEPRADSCDGRRSRPA